MSGPITGGQQAAADRGTGEVPAQTAGQQLRQAASLPGSGSGRPAVIASALDEAALAAMRADAEATAGPFADPALLRTAELALAGIDAAWLERVIGHQAGSWRSLGHAEMLLAVRAAETDAEHLAALAASNHRKQARERQVTGAAAQGQADAAAAHWQRLRGQLPVPVTVQHNWTARHLDGYEQGADHIVVLEDLHAGRLRRAAGTPLCQAPSRARQLRHVSAGTGDERRLPSCAACLRHAEELAATRQTSSTAQPGTGGHAATPAAASPLQPPAPPGGPTYGTGTARGGASPPRRPATSTGGDDDESSAQAQITGRQLREAAHRYLEDGLLPVPAWAARPDGECCCPRGAGCGRPGKHPRSVRSWPRAARLLVEAAGLPHPRRDRPAVRRRQPVRGREPDGRHPRGDDGHRRRRRRRRPRARQQGWPRNWGNCRRPCRTAPRTAST